MANDVVVDLDSFWIDPSVLEGIPREVCVAHQLIPIYRYSLVLVVAMVDCTNAFSLRDMSFLTRRELAAVPVSREALARAIARMYPEAPLPRPRAAPREKGLSRDLVLAEVARSLRETHPDRADTLLHEIERAPVWAGARERAKCPHCGGGIVWVQRHSK